MGIIWMDTEWLSYTWLPCRLGVFTLFCLDSCLWSSQLSYLLARWQHASGKTTPSRSSHHLEHSFLPFHLLQLLDTFNIHPGMHALKYLGEPKEQPTEYKPGLQIIIPVEPEELPSLPKRHPCAEKGGEWLWKPQDKSCSGDCNFWVPPHFWGDQFGISAMVLKLSFFFSC